MVTELETAKRSAVASLRAYKVHLNRELMRVQDTIDHLAKPDVVVPLPKPEVDDGPDAA